MNKFNMFVQAEEVYNEEANFNPTREIAEYLHVQVKIIAEYFINAPYVNRIAYIKKIWNEKSTEMKDFLGQYFKNYSANDFYKFVEGYMFAKGLM